MAPGAPNRFGESLNLGQKCSKDSSFSWVLSPIEKSVCAFWHFSAKRASKFCRKNWKKSLSQNDFFFFLIVYKTMHVFKKNTIVEDVQLAAKKVKPNRIFEEKNIYVI